MISRLVSRAARMGPREVVWRVETALRTSMERTRARWVPPRWNRSDLLPALGITPEMRAVGHALAGRRWVDAHRALAHYLLEATPRFVIAPVMRPSFVARIADEFPDRARHAAARADRLLAGEYDLLGYERLSFGSDPTDPDWHLDPVSGRRAPRRFWSAVPYLSPSCGDHKVIWELNRHQHWLTLVRAFWMTGDPKYRALVLEQLSSWLDANPPLTGINWASMLELALRSISWVWALYCFADPDIDDQTPWIVDLLVGLDRQMLHVEHNLSYYFSPNTHLLGEALALYVTGQALPILAASRRRAAIGRRILLDEIERQIESDGGHSERSTHYHRYTLDFYLHALAVAKITQDPAAAALERAVSRLAHAARLLADGIGRFPHLGDDDGGSLLPICGRAADDIGDSLAIAAALVGRPDLRIGTAPEEAFWALAHPALAALLESSRAASAHEPIASGALPATGYYVSRSPAGDHLIVDGGPHGFKNGGHAHADALAVTLHINGLPLLIDPGTACYTIDSATRDRFRSTKLHNTLTIDGRPQSVADGPFHWRRTASSTVRRWRTNPAFDYFDGRHDGYAPLEHRRHVFALHGDLVVVADLVNGEGAHEAAVHWHIHPRWRVTLGGRRASMTTRGGQAELLTPHGTAESFTADAANGLGWYSPAYGRIDPATTIRVSYAASMPFWIVTVVGLNPENPILEVENVPVWAEAGVLGRSTAVRVQRAATTEYVLFAHPIDGWRTAWRIAEFETDARVMFCRLDRERQIARVALVDGSRIRTTGRRRLQVGLPRPVSDLHVDLAVAGAAPGAEARISGPGFGARVVVGGRELTLAVERRSAPRLSINTM